ncbi:GlmL-related ornithine degradation protein [Geosporobacter ferrireducens]|uniref:DNA mismatch repair protein MutL n=1 Tax=Geosporobacter ferrireducens TaxID=1424294 RepID=A0A1D8GPK2_9FIRM|nr:GlmL-related ornithine degradation protein [Geosporobacter ferrireducens]AOT72842.1 DNA mismatch repair protein MutL [Geosporobacter ferrireducens]MTI55241.1 DNA mismatch repair protein MutL [Geosporobacter ferrireducens]
MKINILVAEIGSTTTVVNAFADIHSDCPRFLGQGQAPTTVLEGDVNIGLQGAIADLKKNLQVDDFTYDEMLATSSAAGGLKMTVHGLVYDMTVRAAKEAALGAGAIIHKVTGGKLRKTDLKSIIDIKPNLILIAGGVDYGERETALFNAELIADLDIDVPIIYAGNVENQEEIREIFKDKANKLYIVENVYPKIDQLNIEPTRFVIQEAFEEHIIHAPGMARVRELVTGPIIPTPGAVMEASKLLRDSIGDLITLDVGGATTDVHSVTEGSDEINRILISPEPLAKRTVEGDLGVYVNMKNIVERIGKEDLQKQLDGDLEMLIETHKPIPDTPMAIQFVETLTLEAVLTAMNRHSGKLRHLYGPTGKKTLAEGKDLTNIQWIIGTGGALTRLPKRIEILKEIALRNKGDYLLPTPEAQILIDNHYIMASLGVLSKRYPEAALNLMKQSLKLEEE